MRGADSSRFSVKTIPLSRFGVVACLLCVAAGCAGRTGPAEQSFSDAKFLPIFLPIDEAFTDDAVRGTWDAPRNLPLNSFAEAEASQPVAAEGPRKDSDAAVFSFETKQPGQLVISLHHSAHIEAVLRQGCGDESKEIVPAVLTEKRKGSTVLTVPRAAPGIYCLSAWSVGGDAPVRFGVYARTLPSKTKARRCETAPLLTLSEQKQRGVRAAFLIDERNSEGLRSFGSDDQDRRFLQSVRRLRFSYAQRLAVLTSYRDFVNVCIENGCGAEAKVTACKSISGITPLYVTLPAGTYVIYASPQGTDGRFGADIGIDAAPVEAARRDPVAGNTAANAVPLDRDALQHRISLDTLRADDTTSNSIGGAGASDLFFSFSVSYSLRVQASLLASSFNATLCLSRNTDAGPADLRCVAYEPGSDSPVKIDETLDPGDYFLIIDGRTPTDFGRALLRVDMYPPGDGETPW